MDDRSFHKSNFGSFGGNLPSDIDGYVHLTAEGWLSAPMDALSDLTQEQAEQLAKDARIATEAAAEKCVEWQGRL